jgi:hypothetical protein
VVFHFLRTGIYKISARLYFAARLSASYGKIIFAF